MLANFQEQHPFYRAAFILSEAWPLLAHRSPTEGCGQREGTTKLHYPIDNPLSPRLRHASGGLVFATPRVRSVNNFFALSHLTHCRGHGIL
jgi:hypothetical protein